MRCICTDAVNVMQVSVPGSQTQECAFQSSVHWLLSGQMLESQGLVISHPSSTWIFNACCMLILAVLVAVSPILTPCDTFAYSQSLIHETVFSGSHTKFIKSVVSGIFFFFLNFLINYNSKIYRDGQNYWNTIIFIIKKMVLSQLADFCCSVSVGNICLHFQIFILPLMK